MSDMGRIVTETQARAEASGEGHGIHRRVAFTDSTVLARDEAALPLHPTLAAEMLFLLNLRSFIILAHWQSRRCARIKIKVPPGP